MMDKIVPDLLRTYRQKIVAPIIVEAKVGMFDTIRAQLKEVVPVNLLTATFRSFTPRIMPLIEFPLSKWKEIEPLNMIATVLTSNLIEEVAQWSNVEKIYPDYLKFALQTVPSEGIFKDYKGKDFTTTYWTKKMLGMDRANKQGFTGKGITAAVIDTGARKSHPMLRRVMIHTVMAEKGGSGMDSNGHGSWCNSTVGGIHATDPRYNVPVEGMAPQCNLASIQALGFVVGMGTSSDIICGMETSIKLGAKIVSMSLGSNDAPKDEENPEAKAINNLVKNGVIPCIAAGNSGPQSSTVGSPGCCRNSLTVGAWDELKNSLADFSSRGPTAGDGYIKPDVVTPGVNIDSALIGFLDAEVDPTEPRYGPISGTCVPDDVMIGDMPMKEIMPLDVVPSILGRDLVLAKWYQGMRRVFRVVTEDDYEAEATPEHLFLIYRNNRYTWRPLISLLEGDEIVSSCSLEQREETRKKPSNIKTCEETIPRPKMESYIFGKQPSNWEEFLCGAEPILRKASFTRNFRSDVKENEEALPEEDEWLERRDVTSEESTYRSSKELLKRRLYRGAASSRFASSRYNIDEGWSGNGSRIWGILGGGVEEISGIRGILSRYSLGKPETSKVKRISRGSIKKVWDITTPSHTFKENELMVHNSMATPHTAGIVTCMAQLYREKVGKELTVDEVKKIMEVLGKSKDNNTGWGFLSWDIIESWVSTTYGITL